MLSRLTLFYYIINISVLVLKISFKLNEKMFLGDLRIKYKFDDITLMTGVSCGLLLFSLISWLVLIGFTYIERHNVDSKQA